MSRAKIESMHTRPFIRWKGWILGIILVVQSVVIGTIIIKQSVTFDETGHLVAGIAHWRYGDFSLYAVNPPLPRLVATLPALQVVGEFEFPSFNEMPERREELRLGILLSTQVDKYHYFSVIARLALHSFASVVFLTEHSG